MKGKKRMKKKEKDYELVSLELNKNYEDISEEEKKQLEKLDTISISFDQIKDVAGIDYGQWKDKKVLSLIKIWRLSSILNGSEIRSFQIIEEISFPLLTTLNLLSKVQTIEWVNKLNAPNLNHLNIGCNNIHSIKSLRKCVFSLNVLGIVDNDIRDQQYFPELRLKNELSQYVVEYKKTQNISAVWIAKLPSQKLDRLVYKSPLCIKQPLVQSCIRKKYLQLNIDNAQE